MQQQHIASVKSPATVLETAVYINMLAHITECIALDSSPKDRNRIQPCHITQKEVFNTKWSLGCPANAAAPGRAHALSSSVRQRAHPDWLCLKAPAVHREQDLSFCGTGIPQVLHYHLQRRSPQTKPEPASCQTIMHPAIPEMHPSEGKGMAKDISKGKGMKYRSNQPSLKAPLLSQ